MEEKKEKEITKFRARNFNLILYPEDESHAKAIEYIERNFDYAMILHDRDCDEYGEIKKEHYHVVLRFKNAKWNTALAEELNITSNYIEESRSLKHSLLYLIHYFDEDKFQYVLDDVKGSLKTRLKDIINNSQKTSDEKSIDIMKWIDEQEYITISQFMWYCSSIGYWNMAQRGFSMFSRYIEEHNQNLIRNNE